MNFCAGFFNADSYEGGKGGAFRGGCVPFNRAADHSGRKLNSASKSGFLFLHFLRPELNGRAAFRSLQTYREEMREKSGAAYRMLPIETDKTFQLCFVRLY